MAATLADNIFKCISFNEIIRISLKISLKFVPKVRISNIPALVQIMAWHQPGDKPLSEPMMVSLQMHITCMCHINVCYIQAGNKNGPTFYRQHFQMHFLECKFMYIIEISLKYVCEEIYVSLADVSSFVFQLCSWFRTSSFWSCAACRCSSSRCPMDSLPVLAPSLCGTSAPCSKVGIYLHVYIC